jgi:2-phosphosulfolactate phosphatase
VIPAGERWGVDVTAVPGTRGSLRPCVEDHLGAGAVVDALLGAGSGRPSPEASLAALTFRAATEDIAALVAHSVSGEELRAAGQAGLVAHAVDIGASATAPQLSGGVFDDGLDSRSRPGR